MVVQHHHFLAGVQPPLFFYIAQPNFSKVRNPAPWYAPKGLWYMRSSGFTGTWELWTALLTSGQALFSSICAEKQGGKVSSRTHIHYGGALGLGCTGS